MSEDLYRFFRRMRQEEQRYRYGRELDERRALAKRIERATAWRLAELGHHVTATRNNARCDLIVDDALRVEVKAATWTAAHHGSGRYQAHLHNDADLLVFCCVNGSDHFFVIPDDVLETRSNIAIWSHDPAEYAGQWSDYLERWDLVPLAVQAAKETRSYQLSLF